MPLWTWSQSPNPPPRPPPVVQATVVSVPSSGSQSAAGNASGETAAKAALPSPPQPPVPQEPCIKAPASFPSLERLSVDEMRNLKENKLIMDDWILELPQVQAITRKLKEAREENSRLSADILSHEEEVSTATSSCETCQTMLKERLRSVEALSRERNEILKHRSQQQATTILATRAQQADTQAEEMLQDALSGEAMNASALADFRKRFVQQKMEKHWRLAIKAAS